MATKKCPKCQYVTEDEALSICPLCEAELEECEEVQEVSAAAEEKNITEDAPASVPEVSDEVTPDVSEEGETADNPEADEDNIDTENEEDAEDAEEPKKSKTGYIIAIAVLVVLILAGALYIGSSYLGGSKAPKTIDVESFGKDSVSGLFTSDVHGRYFEFTIQPTEVQLPSEDASLESEEAAASDAEPENVETVTHDGVFVSAFTDEYISKQCVAEYIRMNKLTEDFEAFVAEKKLSSDDYSAYVKAKKLEEDVNAFDEEYGFTEYMQGNSSNGTWVFEDNKVKLFDSNGSAMYDLEVTPYGLVNTNTYFKGKIGFGKTVNAALDCVAEDVDLGDGTTADITQSLIFYKDGNFILKEEYKGDTVESSYSAGPYEIEGNVITIELQGSKNKFLILGDGICLGAFTK